jgi:hypothetical protein
VIQEYVLAKGMIFQVGNTLLAENIIQQDFDSSANQYWTCYFGNTAVNIFGPTYGLSNGECG